ncbi:MAG: IS110 family transposase [Nitriliruptoraceae bacterium]|nr:IS110 family transposase [Nitriliruptoraceae bacterium]
MTDTATLVIGGVDAHHNTHHAVALDERGQRLGDAEFPVTADGYEQLLGWLADFGTIVAIGVESTGNYAAGLTRFLLAADVAVIEINQPHQHLRSRRGKTDAIDAEAAARKVLSGEATGLPKDTTGIVESIRQLRVVHQSAVKARSAALVQLGQLIVTAPAELREHLSERKTLKGKATVCARLRPELTRANEPLQAAKIALRSLGRRIADLDDEIRALDRQLDELVAQAAPRTTALFGVGTHNAAQLLCTAGENIDRIHDEAAFAHLCAAAPIQASSGKTQRHRLNPGGDRAANRSLHMIVVVRLRYCERTKLYMKRRTVDGKTKREIMRCLKRYIAREIYTTLRHDLAQLQTA